MHQIQGIQMICVCVYVRVCVCVGVIFHEGQRSLISDFNLMKTIQGCYIPRTIMYRISIMKMLISLCYTYNSTLCLLVQHSCIIHTLYNMTLTYLFISFNILVTFKVHSLVTKRVVILQLGMHVNNRCTTPLYVIRDIECIMMYACTRFLIINVLAYIVELLALTF